MADQPPSRMEINAVLQRVLSLPDAAKFEVFKLLQDELSATVLNDPRTRLIEQRNETLRALEQAREHLGLPAGTPPTTKQFDTAAKALKLSWSSASIIRLWGGRWNLAAEVFKGEKADRVKGSRLAGRNIRKNRTPEDYLDDVKLWLASNPEELSMKAYEAFVTQFNLTASRQEALSRGKAISRYVNLRWRNVVAVAKGEISHKDAVEQELAEVLPGRGEEALVGLPAIARLLRIPLTRVEDKTRDDKNFPTFVAHIHGQRAWDYEDIKLYKRGLPTPSRVEDEKQALYMDATEIAELLEIRVPTLSGQIREKRWGHVPRPEGAVYMGYFYWKREKVEAWLKAKATMANS